MKFGENWPSGFREKLFNKTKILYMYTAQGHGKITLAEKKFDCNLKPLLLQSNIVSFRHLAIFVCVCVSLALKICFCQSAGTCKALTFIE